VLFALAILLLVLIGLVCWLLVAQTRASRLEQPPARLQDSETERIVAALHERQAEVQGQFLKVGAEQLATQNKGILEAETARGEQQLKARQSEIDKSLLEVRKEIGKLGEWVREVDARRGESIVKLETVTRESKQQTELLRASTGRLNEMLSGTQARGQWGERMAEDVLRVAGFIEGVQYSKQQQLAGGASRPDFTFFVHNQLLHMDVKTPMSEYQRYLTCENEAEREGAAKAFKRDVRLRIKEVATRDYIDPEGGTLDYTLAFIPNEQVYGFIHENDPELLDLALAHKVVLCSPLTLFAILAVIRQASDNFKLTQQTNAILQALGGFNNEWSKYKGQMDKLGNALERSSRAYEDLVGVRTRQLDKQVDRVEALRLNAGLAQSDAGIEDSARADDEPAYEVQAELGELSVARLNAPRG
jgi:DNA recombination protein RmuC